jgi:CheY-like chemotaxis protein
MSNSNRTIEDTSTIRMTLQRLCVAGSKVSLGCRDKRGLFQILFQEPGRVGIRLGPKELEEWAMGSEESVSVTFEDRGFRYETVIGYLGPADLEGVPCGAFTLPRTLRRADDNRLAFFAPDQGTMVTFSNSKNALLDGEIRGFGTEGFELVLRDSSQKIEDVLRMGEESTLDLALEDGLLLTASARVAYFRNNLVGMKFTDRVDKTLLGQYRDWLDNQQRLQAQRDRDSFESGKAPAKAPSLPPARLWVDRHPTILILTEREEFARHMSEALGRKFGVLSLDYITGKVKPFLEPHGADEEGWGRVKLILIHNHLRLASPLELSKQIVEQEKCTLPIILVGTDEDEDLKRNRALAFGAIDYMPIEPFKILSVLRKLDDTLKLFA